MSIFSEQNLETTLTLRRTFHAPRAKVFEAWTTPDMIRRWMGGMHITRPVAQVDLRVGGQYRVKMQAPGGTPFFVVGTYREVRIPERLVYTWSFEDADIDTGETLVTVEFHDLGNLTEVILHHERFPNLPIRDSHHEGWIGCLDALTDVL
ncbi:MAG TPA: SRPBCC domain-containing protein [Aggregatilineales bacterium]|nr:SRPBCC domain-containing protein [Aggregatilineales bacterium]